MTLLKRDFKKKMDEEAHTSTFKKGTGQASDFKERSPPEKKTGKRGDIVTLGWGGGCGGSPEKVQARGLGFVLPFRERLLGHLKRYSGDLQ